MQRMVFDYIMVMSDFWRLLSFFMDIVHGLTAM